MKQRMGLLLVLSLATASVGFPQSSGNSGSPGSNNGGSGAGANSSSGSTAQSVINMPASKSQFIETLAGVAGSPGPFPGYAGDNGPCYVLRPTIEQVLSMDAIRSMAKGYKFDKHDANWSTAYPNLIPENDDPIAIVDYNAKMIMNPGDQLLASGVIPGKYLRDEDGLIAVALLEAKKRTHTRRVSIAKCTENEIDTKGLSVGIGISSAEVPGGGNNAEAGSLGFSYGTTRARKESHEVLFVFALNDGPTIAPELPQPTRVEEPITPPPPQTVNVNINLDSLVPLIKELLPKPPAPAPTMPAPEQEQLPQVSVYFAFDHPKPYEGAVFAPVEMTEDGPQDNAAAIRTIQQWLEAHPSVKIDVIGYACFRADPKYNWDLAGRRAKAVFKALITDEKIRGQVFEYDSNGKETAAPTGSKEHNWWDRRASFRIQGSDSSGR